MALTSSTLPARLMRELMTGPNNHIPIGAALKSGKLARLGIDVTGVVDLAGLLEEYYQKAKI